MAEQSEAKSSGIEKLLDEMKGKGINGAVVRKDGVLVQSTIALNDVGANMIASVANVSDAMLKKAGDAQKSMEIVFSSLIFVLVPVGDHIFCGVIKDREEKKAVLEFAKRAAEYL